jgi:hypothetical protein
MNAGIGDAVALGKALDTALERGSTDPLEAYTAAQRPVAEAVEGLAQACRMKIAHRHFGETALDEGHHGRPVVVLQGDLALQLEGRPVRSRFRRAEHQPAGPVDHLEPVPLPVQLLPRRPVGHLPHDARPQAHLRFHDPARFVPSEQCLLPLGLGERVEHLLRRCGEQALHPQLLAHPWPTVRPAR